MPGGVQLFRSAFFLSLALALQAQPLPAFKLRVTRGGLDYANRVASDLLNNEIRTLRIHDSNHSIEGGGKVRLKNVRLTNFREPAYTYSLIPPSTFSWKLRNAGVQVAGDWWAKKRVLILLESTGSVMVDATDITINLSAKFGRNATNLGKPTIVSAKCAADIGKFQIEVKGGIVASVMNVFKDLVSAQLKPIIERELCERARGFLLNDVNAKLATFPIRAPIHQAFALDYGLVADPMVTADYCEIALKGRIVPTFNLSLTSPFTPDPLANTYDGDRMFYAWASDTTINDLLYFAHTANMTRYLVTRDTPGASSFLRIRCDSSDSCLGSAIPDIPDMFPPTVETAEASLTTSSAPFVRIKEDGSASLSVNGTIDLYAYLTNSSDVNSKKSIAVCSIISKADMRVRIENMRLVGNVNISQFEVRVLESEIDEFTLFMLESSIPGVAAPLLEKYVNERFAIGFPIPVTRGVSLIRPVITLLRSTVQVESGVQYVG